MKKILLSLVLGSVGMAEASDSTGKFDKKAALDKLRQYKSQSELAIQGNVQDLERRNSESEKNADRRLGEATEKVHKHMAIRDFEARQLLQSLETARHRFEREVAQITDINQKLGKDLQNFRRMIKDAKDISQEYYDLMKQEVKDILEENELKLRQLTDFQRQEIQTIIDELAGDQ